MAVTTLALSELVKSEESPHAMQMCVPFTLRDFPRTLSQLEVNNDFACIPFWIRFLRDGDDGRRVSIYQRAPAAASDAEECKEQIKSAEFVRDAGLRVMTELRATMRTKRAKFESIGWYYMMKFFLFLLRYPLNYQPTGVATYYHSVLSLVPGPKDRFKFGTPSDDRDGSDV